MNKEVNVVVGVIQRYEQVLIAKRSEAQHQGGLWEFPGGKVESNESEIDALVRELHEELGIEVKRQPCDKMLELHHQYPDKAVHLNIYCVTDFTGEPIGREGQPVRWVALSELSDYEFPSANAPILEALIDNA